MHKEDCKEDCEHDHKCECCEDCKCCQDCECCKEQKTGKLDEILGKAVSRKLLVFMCATGLDPDTWAMIAAMYIGGQSVIDVAKVWKGM